jgi:hypothetical protein
VAAPEPWDDRANHKTIRNERDRVVANPVLAKSPQLANFLTFIVDETLAGRGDRLKAYTIATDALGRDADFDPQTDPIVRVEAGRLRRALEQYYAGDGRDDPVIIELPLGGYAPEFRANTAMHRAAARTQNWPGWTFGGLRENFRLVLLVAAVAAVVSLSFDLLEMLIDKRLINEQSATTAPSQATTGTNARAELPSPTCRPRR